MQEIEVVKSYIYYIYPIYHKPTRKNHNMQ